MKVLAIALTTIREHFRWPVAVVTLIALVVWVTAFDTTAASGGGIDVHERERVVFGAITALGSMLAIFASTAAFAEDIRLRRLDLLLLRPVSPVVWVFGKLLGIAFGLAVFVVVAAIAGYSWIAKGAAAEGRDLALFRQATPVAVELEGRPIEEGDVLSLSPGGPALRLRFEGIDRLGEDGRLTMRVTAFREKRIALRTPIEVAVGPDDDRLRSEIVNVRRSFAFAMRLTERDVAADGSCVVTLRTVDVGCRLLVERASWRVRAARVSHAISYSVAVAASTVGLLLLASVGVALSIVLSAPTGAFALGFTAVAGFLQTFIRDLSRVVRREAAMGGSLRGGHHDHAHDHVHDHAHGAASHAHSATEIGAGADGGVFDALRNAALHVDAWILHVLGTVPPPLASFQEVDRLASGRPVVASALFGHFGVAAAYAVPALAIGVFWLGRRSRR